jgi:uridine kinase
MENINIKLSNNKTFTTQAFTPAIQILDQFENKEQIVALRINNEICSVLKPIRYNSYIEPVYLNTTDGSQIYRRTLCFVLGAAAKSVFPDTRLLVGHSLGHGYYYTLESGHELKQKDLDRLCAKMKEYVDANLPITQTKISYEDALNLFKNSSMTETAKQLKYICPPSFTINKLKDFSDFYYGPLLYSTGLLKVFELMKYGEGFLLRFPNSTDHSRLTNFEDIPKLFNIYSEYKKWGKMLGVTSASSLNELVYKRKTKDFIDITENLQVKHIAEIADQIKNRGNVKVVLIAGPSSSGKTTTSKKLAIQLQVNGYNPKLIELDTYYKGRNDTPKDENGEYDYECLEALDVQQLNDDLVDLFAGKEIKLPSYDFVEGKRFYSGKTLKLEENDILVMEGIHGLNDKLTPRIPKENKFKIYLSALTQLNIDDHNRIATSDNRLIRRIVRDSQFRGKSAAETIKMWPSVQKGERLHIFPFQNNADAMLNTALDYEISVLKVYAEPLLKCVSPLQPEYSEASRLLTFLKSFLPIPVTNVPGQSLIREFVGGSDFKY